MNKEALITVLDDSFKILVDFLNTQNIEEWTLSPKNKHTTGQQALHILQTIKAANDLMSIPKFIIRLRFGKTDRLLYDYDSVTNRFLEHLQKPLAITSSFSEKSDIPKISDKNYILTRLTVENKKLQYKIDKWSDNSLDTLLLPHPIMGKMPVRELIMITIFDVEYHTKQLLDDYTEIGRVTVN